ncbi:carboxymuconolactone decarboxylase family protein [Nocardioides cavernae]|uniref:Carboxymuconolactone decarboxylase family protein n=1 Tax=Nocardioides cavernae TaxID=1921566 RepID=A0ABR8NAQ4_9ACTN|nr:carboxymuconolactone decarboxylase family protein [Nocardioides cavernae]MBD3923939.1 carboxymuconolactone decarboxylase family protein [Nocardioides cavernae]MBM7511125.1 AhpD family alkylhydroperoxidase [Nocardioides cavernae]
MSETRVPPAEMTGAYAALVKAAIRKKLGGVPAGLQVMWHHRDVLRDTMKFGRRSERWDRLDHTLATLATMTAAAEVGCSFCLDFHYFLSQDKGLGEEKAREVPRWRDSTVYTPVERRVMAYAAAMCQTPVEVTDEMSAALLDDLGPDGLVELTARVGVMNMTARGNVALGIRSEHYSDACGLPPMAERTDVASTS